MDKHDDFHPDQATLDAIARLRLEKSDMGQEFPHRSKHDDDEESHKLANYSEFYL
jgi:hypothetical protein